MQESKIKPLQRWRSTGAIIYIGERVEFTILTELASGCRRTLNSTDTFFVD